MTRTRYVAQAGVIAAVHVTLSFLTMQTLTVFSWGPIQFRLSEAFSVIACFTPAAIPGLTLGTALANLTNITVLGPLALLDVVFGSAATAIGAMWTWRFREKRALALAGPVVANALIVPAYLPWLVKGLGLYQIPALGINLEQSWLGMYLFGVVAVGIGEAFVVYGLGWPLLAALNRLGLNEVLTQRT